MDDQTAISTRNLTKNYGKNRGIANLDLEVERGIIFGFLGPNGAGKTTTINLLMDFIRPDAGRASVFGLDCRRESVAVHRCVGYVASEPPLYPGMTVERFLGFSAALRQTSVDAAVREAAEALDLPMEQRIGRLSHGNRQKTALVRALLGRPTLLILDEPTAGLDPLAQRSVNDILRRYRGAGGTVFLSSHALPEVERTCDKVGILREGKLIATETMSALRHKAARHITIHFAVPIPDDAFSGVEGIGECRVHENRVSCTLDGAIDPIIKRAAKYPVTDVITEEPSLEDLFLRLYGTRGEGQFADSGAHSD